MPERVAPFVAIVPIVLEGVDTHNPDPEYRMPTKRVSRDDLDQDWTLHEDRDIEWKRREERNKLVKQALQHKHSVKFRSSGWSLYPKVHSGDSCTYAPVADVTKDVQEEDVVFCQVQPKGYFYAHIVKKIWYTDQGLWKCVIANRSGDENGWCYAEHIYGKLIAVER